MPISKAYWSNAVQCGPPANLSQIYELEKIQKNFTSKINKWYGTTLQYEILKKLNMQSRKEKRDK